MVWTLSPGSGAVNVVGPVSRSPLAATTVKVPSPTTCPPLITPTASIWTLYLPTWVTFPVRSTVTPICAPNVPVTVPVAVPLTGRSVPLGLGGCRCRSEGDKSQGEDAKDESLLLRHLSFFRRGSR